MNKSSLLSDRVPAKTILKCGLLAIILGAALISLVLQMAGSRVDLLLQTSTFQIWGLSAIASASLALFLLSKWISKDFQEKSLLTAAFRGGVTGFFICYVAILISAV